jgi:bacteriocin biosynthesis cyclodehydratase domain-containing protein
MSAQGLDPVVVAAHEALPVVTGHDAVVLATDRPYPAKATEIDLACWDAGVPWFAAQAVAHEFRVGPIIVPGQTLCLECFGRRLRSVAPDIEAHVAIDRHAAASPPGPWFRGELDALTEQVAAIAVAEAVTLCTGQYQPPPHRLARYWEGDAVFGMLRSRLVARVGLCARCSAGEQKDRSWRGLSEAFNGRRFRMQREEP